MPTEVKDEAVTPDAKVVPVRVPAAAVTVMLPVPSKETPLMVRAFCRAVAVVALPESAPEKVVAVTVGTPEILPEESMTMEGVLRKLVKPVAELKLTPLILLELVLVAAWKLIPLVVLELLELVPLAKVRSRPETAVAPAAPEASVTVKDSSLEASAVKEVLV